MHSGVSTTHGDLRIAHFLGLHSLQTVPLFAVVLNQLCVSASTVLTVAFSVVYFAVFMFLFEEAMSGRTLI